MPVLLSVVYYSIFKYLLLIKHCFQSISLQVSGSLVKSYTNPLLDFKNASVYDYTDYKLERSAHSLPSYNDIPMYGCRESE